MVKTIFAAVATAAMLFTTACSSEEPKPLTNPSAYGEVSNQASTTEATVEMNAEHPSYSVSTDKITVKIKNAGPATLTFGTPYKLEKREQGTWYEVPFRSDVAFTDVGILLKPGDTYEDHISMSTHDFTATKGEYRMIKTLYANRKEITLAAAFQIE
ncbi:immunoglobulin-like domain-containing protein [Brevibacillus borstelensis]|uniref:immunoglobulin-like domain-containing protein n=1 Tax=Brevibacillus borstelensis TaxID=45462 RepID=UPI0030BD0744